MLDIGNTEIVCTISENGIVWFKLDSLITWYSYKNRMSEEETRNYLLNGFTHLDLGEFEIKIENETVPKTRYWLINPYYEQQIKLFYAELG